MNRFANPHTTHDNGYPQNVDPRGQHALPHGHPYGPMYPPSMARPMPPGIDPRLLQQPQGYDPRYHQPPQGNDPRFSRGPLVHPGMMPPEGYDPRFQPNVDPRYMDPRQMQRPQQVGNGMVQQYAYQVDTPRQQQQEQPQQRQSTQDDNSRYGPGPTSFEVRRPQPVEPTPTNKKEFMAYNPFPSVPYNDESEGYKISSKKTQAEPKSYSVNKSIDCAVTIDGALESILKFLCNGDSSVASQMFNVEDQYHRLDFNQEIYDLLTEPTVKGLVFKLTEHFRKVNNKDVLIVLTRLNEYLTQRINDLLLINSPGVLVIDSFKDDYFELINVLQNNKQNSLLDIIEGFFENIQNTTTKYILADDTPEELMTMIPQLVTMTAIDAIAREARIEHLVSGVTLLVEDSNTTKYLYSVMKMVKENFITIPDDKLTENDVDKRFNKHYLVTLDKRVFEMAWSEINGSAYITRLA